MSQSREVASKSMEASSSDNPKKITLQQSIIIGSIAGGTEVAINHPLWSIKTRIQQQEPFTFRPSVLYRGIIPNVSSMIPITAVQVGLNQFIKDIFYSTSPFTQEQQIRCAFLAGIGSAFVSAPTEMIMTQQGIQKKSFFEAGQYIIQEGGYRALVRGLPATMLREGPFTACFLAGTPLIKDLLKPYIDNDFFLSVTAGTGAGIGASTATQGIDTIKTMQQSSPVSRPLSFANAAQKVYSEKGIYGFFKGGIPRSTRIASAITVMSYVAEKMETKFRPK